MAAVTSQRPWEMSRDTPGSASSSRGLASGPSQLPSITALTNSLPHGPPPSAGIPSPASTRERDSGAWSSQNQSTRSSAYSAQTSNYMSSNTNSYYMSPNRASAVSHSSSHVGSTSHPSVDYSTAQPSSVTLHSPSFAGQPNSQLPSLNQSHEPNRAPADFPPQESRRSSIGSQVNQGLHSLKLNNGASSPYSGSVNHSTTSLAQNLRHERGIGGPLSLRQSRSSAQLPMSPVSPPMEEDRDDANSIGNFAPRIAPPIGRNPRSDIYNATEPIPGQAYAFPDAPDLEPGALPPKSAISRHGGVPPVPPLPPFPEENRSVALSRRDTDDGRSVASSVTTDSRLPAGQHFLDDGNVNTHHHHSLQQAQMGKLSGESSMTPEDSAQPYSRTPALRVSHKMAERKRRSEMKDLFENLRSQIPSSQGSKSSKWEILMKASDYIKQLESMASNSHMAEKQLRHACHDLDMTRRDNDGLRNENSRLLQELAMLRSGGAAAGQQSGPGQPPQRPHSSSQQQSTSASHAASGGQPPSGGSTGMYSGHYAGPPPPPPSMMHDPSRSLPPLTNGINASSSMQGVQYSHEHR